jgi:zinc D-Ala-D-Ala dipeptidase
MVPEKILYIADEVIQSVPMRENGEKLVNLFEYAASRKSSLRSADGVMVREGIADKLIQAEQFLPDEVDLFVFEGHRSSEKQNKLWQKHRDEIAKRHNDWLESEIDAEATKLYSPPGSVMSHATGSAVDVTLLDKFENWLDMGTDINADAESTEGRTYTLAENINEDQKRNRGMLIDALNSVGLVNYPTEWWHWSYGDQYATFMLKQPFAIYSIIESYEK